MMSVGKQRIFPLSALGLFFLVVLLTGCAGGQLAKPKAPGVKLSNVQLVSAGLTQQTVRLTLDLDNPNAFMLPLRGLGYQLKLNGKSFISGNSAESVDIPANGSSALSIDVSADLLSLFNNIQSLGILAGAPVNYELSGSVGVLSQGLKLPFSRSGQVKIQR